jgi:superfamily I DNA/RNA helicase
MAQVDAVVCGVEVKGMVLMTSKYDGFDPHTCTRFKVGDQIAFKNKTDLTQEQKEKIFPNGKVYNLTVQWPLKPSSKFPESQIVENTIDSYVPPSPFIPKPVSFKPSEYQEDIFQTLLNSKDHILIEALAGSGKTSTLVWLIQELSNRKMTQNMRIIYLAFNKSIQEELAEKLQGTGVPAQTTHAFGLGLLKKRFGPQINIDNNKTSETFTKILCDENGFRYSAEAFKAVRKTEEYKLRSPVLEMVSYIKNWGIFPDSNGVFNNDDLANIYQLIDMYEVEFDSIKFTDEQLVNYSSRVVSAGIPKAGESIGEISFDDMLYLPLCLNLPFPKYDLVLTDESQDFNALQIGLIEKLSKG